MGMFDAENSIPILGFYDFSQLATEDAKRVLIVDVGGGQGQSLKARLTAFPELPSSKMVLQDLPHVIEQAVDSDTLPKDVIKMPHNFYDEQPVKGPYVSFLCTAVH